MVRTQLHLTAWVYNTAIETVLLKKLQIDCQHNI